MKKRRFLRLPKDSQIHAVLTCVAEGILAVNASRRRTDAVGVALNLGRPWGLTLEDVQCFAGMTLAELIEEAEDCSGQKE